MCVCLHIADVLGACSSGELQLFPCLITQLMLSHHWVHLSRERPYSGKGRSNKWARQPMQAAVHCALSWDAIIDALSVCNPPMVAGAPGRIADS